MKIQKAKGPSLYAKKIVEKQSKGADKWRKPIPLIDWEVIKKEWESIGWIEKNTEDTFHWFKAQIDKQL